MLYKITLHGCDDSTRVQMDLTDEEAHVIQQLSTLSINESTYGCMPTLTITKENHHEDPDYD